MTDLDEIPGLFTAQEAATVIERKPRRRRHRHEWCRNCVEVGVASHCVVVGCGLFQDDPRIRAGRSSRRLGHDQERRIERVYGPVKIGERGDPVDHVGKVWRWQSKATRALPPRWLAAIAEPTWRATAPATVRSAWTHMLASYTDRCPVVIRSFVANGLRTRDWLFVADFDATNELGLPAPGKGWYVIPGDWWLDHFGRDE